MRSFMIRSGHDRSFTYSVRPNSSKLEAMEALVNGLYTHFLSPYS